MKPEVLYRHLHPVLRPFGLPYSLLMRGRRRMYRTGVFSGYVPSCPCVSVGNISWGGTGKTPLVSWLLDWATQRNLKTVVLSRGYGGKPGSRPLLVRPDTPVSMAGDEALMLAQAHPETSVFVFPRRKDAALLAEKELQPDLILLEDGMQHLAVGRDLDIVLLRPDDLDDDWNRVIPSGPWREGPEALSAASIFGIKCDSATFRELEPLIHRRLAGFGKPVFAFEPAPAGLRPLFPRHAEAAGTIFLPPETYRETPYILISGVGNPESVERTAIRLLGRPPVQHFDFADHHPYSAADIQALLNMTPAPLPVVCTAKDAVKLSGFADIFGAVPVWVLDIRPGFGPCLPGDGTTFSSWWNAAWEQLSLKNKGAGGAS